MPATEAEMRAFSWASYSCFLRASSALTKLSKGEGEKYEGERMVSFKFKREIRKGNFIYGGTGCVEVVGWWEREGGRPVISAKHPELSILLHIPCTLSPRKRGSQKDNQTNATCMDISPLSALAPRNKIKYVLGLVVQGDRWACMERPAMTHRYRARRRDRLQEKRAGATQAGAAKGNQHGKGGRVEARHGGRRASGWV